MQLEASSKSPRILIVKLGAVGDCIHALYPLAALRTYFPNAYIAWLVEDKSAKVVIDHPQLDDVFIFQRKKIVADAKDGKITGGIRGTIDLIRSLRRARFDIAIDFQNLLKSGIATALSGAGLRIGFRKLREANFLFTNRWIKPLPDDKHAIMKYMALLRPLGIDQVPPNVLVPISAVAKNFAEKLWKDEGFEQNKVIMINPGGSWPNKIWPAEYFARATDLISDKTGSISLVVWGPGEEDLAQKVVKLTRSRALIAPPTDLIELAAILKKSKLYLGGDTGPMHLASAIGTPVVALFGPSDPNRVGPFGVSHEVISAPCPKIPCWKRSCPDPICITKIEPITVAEAAIRVLESSS